MCWLVTIELRGTKERRLMTWLPIHMQSQTARSSTLDSELLWIAVHRFKVLKATLLRYEYLVLNFWKTYFETTFKKYTCYGKVETDWIPYIRRQVIIISYIGFVRQINFEMKARIVICDTWSMMDLLYSGLGPLPIIVYFPFARCPRTQVHR